MKMIYIPTQPNRTCDPTYVGSVIGYWAACSPFPPDYRILAAPQAPTVPPPPPPLPPQLPAGAQPLPLYSPLAMEAAVAPPALCPGRSLHTNPNPATRPGQTPRPWNGLAANPQANAVRCELSRRPEPRVLTRAAAATQQDAGDAAGAGRRKRLAVFVSGGGSNFRAIHEAALGGAVHGDVVALVTDKPGEESRIKRNCSGGDLLF